MLRKLTGNFKWNVLMEKLLKMHGLADTSVLSRRNKKNRSKTKTKKICYYYFFYQAVYPALGRIGEEPLSPYFHSPRGLSDIIFTRLYNLVFNSRKGHLL